MLVDCRKPFNNTRCAKYHNGHYDEFVRNIVEHPKFIEWLSKVKQDLLWRSIGRSTGAFRIGVFCKQGNKHSVGCSLILQFILERHGYRVEPVIHCRKAFWPARNTCNSSCEKCQNGDDASRMKKLALWDANKAWNLLPIGACISYSMP